MEKNIYFHLMKQTSESVAAVLISHIESFLDRDPQLREVVSYFASKRLATKTLLKPWLLKLCYEISGGKDWDRFISIAAAVELLNISSYQANSAFDAKYGVFSKTEKDNQFIASILTREWAGKIISSEIKQVELAQKLQVILSLINEKIYVGQYHDLNVLHLDRLDLSISLSMYLDLYEKRCYGLSGAINEHIAEIGGLLADTSTEKLAALREFGRNFGIALQIINDIGDLLPPGIDSFINREYQDQLSDLKNYRATLPVFYFLKFGNFETDGKTYIKSAIRSGDSNKLILSIEQSGAIQYAKMVARQFAVRARRQLALFDNSLARKLLSVATSIASSNKYYVALRKINIPAASSEELDPERLKHQSKNNGEQRESQSVVSNLVRNSW